MRKYALRFTLLGLLGYIGILFGLSMFLHADSVLFYAFMIIVYSAYTLGIQDGGTNFIESIYPVSTMLGVLGGLFFLGSGFTDNNSLTMLLSGVIYALMGFFAQKSLKRLELEEE